MPHSDLNGTCSFELDPESWSEAHGKRCHISEENLQNGVWKCPHDSVSDRSKCIYHLDPDETPPDRTAKDELLAAVNKRDWNHHTEALRAKQFIGGKFESLALPNALFSAPDQYPIDLRYSTIDGELNWDQARFEQPVKLDGTVCTGDVTLDEATFDHPVTLNQMHCKGELSCKHTVFNNQVSGFELEVERSVVASGATVGGAWEFHGATFHDDAKFERVSFEGRASFTRATFDGTGKFSYATFEAEASFGNASFEEGNFLLASFEKGASFSDVYSRRDFTLSGGDVQGDATFQRARFCGDIEATNVGFSKNLYFDKSTVVGCLQLDRSRFTGRATLRGVSFDDLSLDSCTVDGELLLVPDVCRTAVVSATGADIDEATIAQPTENSVVYDVSGATLGDVTFEGRDNHPSPLANVVFRETDFDGFDFPSYRSAMSALDYRLHEIVVSPGEKVPTDLENTDPGTLESTYLKAKNGADEVGDGGAAAKFFIKELRNRRRTHLQAVANGSLSTWSRLRRGRDWIQNLLLDLTCVYGERPGQTVIVSGVVVLLFSAFYRMADVNLDEPTTVVTLLKFSLQSFVALIIGGLPRSQPLAVELLTALEAFFGTFLIALFVFALTRSVHR